MTRLTFASRAVRLLLIAACALAAACAAPESLPAAVTPTDSPTAEASLTLLPTHTVSPPKATSTSAEPTATATTALTSATVCSPLEGISLEDLGKPDLLKHPFQLPRPGMDDGHHGADFAYWSRGERKTMLDHPVHAALEGTVAAVLDNHIPYGYAVIIETPLDRLPQAWTKGAVIPTPAPTVAPTGTLFCPPATDELNYSGRSLYLLYAHLSHPPALSVGQTVACGEPIGLVGTTGKSVNYHLHLETRVGPAEYTFSQMNHYDNRATQEEMRSYCTWRVSGLFQMFDPMTLFALQP